MLTRKQFTYAWIAWAVTTTVSFSALETAAIVSDAEYNTLSAHLRDWLGIEPHEPYAMITTAAFLGGCAALGVHIAFGYDFGIDIDWAKERQSRLIVSPDNKIVARAVGAAAYG